MTGTEDRLVEALRARTDLITHDRLTPSVPPVAAEPRSAWRRPALYALAAAACAGAIALPFALSGGDGGRPSPVTPPTTSAPSLPSPATSSSSADRTPAADGFSEGASPFADANHDVLRLDESGPVIRGADASLHLFSFGDVARLEMTLGDGTKSHVDLEPPASAVAAGDLLPTVHTTFVADTAPLVLVRWGGEKGVTQVFDHSGNQFRELPFTSYFGSNQAGEAGGRVWSVLTNDGSFYALHEAGGKIEVYPWRVEYDAGKPVYLALGNQGRPLGSRCSDTPDVPPSYVPC